MRATTPASTAATITVAETLALLDGRFASLAEAVAQGGYAFWLGSGISRERVDDVPKLVRRILKHLQDHIDPNYVTCKFRQALEVIIDLAQLSDAHRKSLDPLAPLDKWPEIDAIVQRLSTRYAEVLDVRIDGESPDYLVWDAVDVYHTYGECAAGPDCEHLCIAILTLEGAIAEIASANWDGLIEAAEVELRGSLEAVQVCVRAPDLRQPPLPTRLFKFHGCAVRAKEDEAAYRPLLVARQSQINAWAVDAAWSPMRNALVHLVVTRPTFIIGMSAQDSNIQHVFNQARATMPWEWPSDPPAYVFAEDSLGIDQRTLLACVYREAYDLEPAAISESAVFRAYAKPLLTALVLHVLHAKLRVFVHLAPAPHLDFASRDALVGGLLALRNRIAVHAEPDRLAFVRNVIRQLFHGLALFHDGQPPPPGALGYRPIGQRPIHQIPGDDMLRAAGQLELAVALALLGAGDQDGIWNVQLDNPDEPSAGALMIETGTSQVRVFFVASSHVVVRLRRYGRITEDDPNVVVVHSADPVPSMPRTPSRAPGRTGRVGLRSVGMETLLRNASDDKGLLLRFREELAL